ncbi:MAG: hypothetical protein Q8L60_06455 [Gammaproteobacteria bacterium]|nr:hypothetical protein [Gammaproteobacteria bacterium]MDP2142059.1 hypothetical protein [Gammaproteobacteria bacterium]MDP2348362.1 hypothetical protein [Gammaproteobacteria bacterium]
MKWHCLVCVLLVSCAQTPSPQVAGPLPVGAVSLMTAPVTPDESSLLNIGVRVFDTAADANAISQAGAAIFAEIRRTETHYLPVVLRSTLVASNQWGVVRVLPQDDPSVDLQINGTITHSDGVTLTLVIQAVDSTGREWLNRTYTDVANSGDYPEFVPSLRDRATTRYMEDPFQDIHEQIANDLLAVRDSLSAESIDHLMQVTQMTYASDLSPDAFAGTLQRDEQGLVTLNRLPAQNDPMLGRVAEIRARHNVFIDTIDEYYEALYQDVKPVYDVWRQYSHDQVIEEQESREMARRGGGGSFEALSQNYNRYKWAKIFEQEFVALASGFVSETAPAILELSRNVNGLTGPVEEQYAQWRELLRQLFEVETGAVQ